MVLLDTLSVITHRSSAKKEARSPLSVPVKRYAETGLLKSYSMLYGLDFSQPVNTDDIKIKIHTIRYFALFVHFTPLEISSVK